MMTSMLGRWLFTGLLFVPLALIDVRIAWILLTIIGVLSLLWYLAAANWLPSDAAAFMSHVRRRLPFPEDAYQLPSGSQPNSSDQAGRGSQAGTPLSKEAAYQLARDGLDGLKGQEPAKNDLKLLAGHAQKAVSRNDDGFGFNAPAVLVLISGPHGTGKTETAKLMAPLFYGIGVLPHPTIMVLTQPELQTAPPSRVLQSIADEMSGGLILIDDVDWAVDYNPETGPARMSEIGPVIAKIATDRPHRFLFAITGTERAIRKIESMEGATRWIGRLHTTSIFFDAVDLEILAAQAQEAVLQRQIRLSVETQRDIAVALREERDHMGDQFDNYLAAQRISNRVIESAYSE